MFLNDGVRKDKLRALRWWLDGNVLKLKNATQNIHMNATFSFHKAL